MLQEKLVTDRLYFQKQFDQKFFMYAIYKTVLMVLVYILLLLLLLLLNFIIMQYSVVSHQAVYWKLVKIFVALLYFFHSFKVSTFWHLIFKNIQNKDRSGWCYADWWEVFAMSVLSTPDLNKSKKTVCLCYDMMLISHCKLTTIKLCRTDWFLLSIFGQN